VVEGSVVQRRDSCLLRKGWFDVATDPSAPSQVPHCPVCDRVVSVDSAGYVAGHVRTASDSFVRCKAVGRRRPRWKSPGKSDQPPVTANFTSKWSDLLVSSGAGLIAMAIAVSLYVNGHWILGTIGALVGALLFLVAWGYYQRSRRTPEEELSFQAKQRETSDRQKEDAQQRKTTKAPALRSQLRSPPPGATPPSPGALFLRLNEKRMHGLSKGPVVNLVCGRCAHSYLVPKSLISEYRREMSPGASLRRFNNPNVALRQDRAQLNLRCPSCGSIDPGVWIDG